MTITTTWQEIQPGSLRISDENKLARIEWVEKYPNSQQPPADGEAVSIYEKQNLPLTFPTDPIFARVKDGVPVRVDVRLI